MGSAVAVTGGAGFIGSNLVDALVDAGHQVVVVDDLSTGKHEHLNGSARFVRLDLSQPGPGLAEAFAGMEVVFHTAALPRIQRSIDEPARTHAVNVTGTLNVLLGARAAGVRRVVYSSSSSVYGDQPTLPLHEEMPPNPLHPYAAQKLMGELYCRQLARHFGLQTIALRYFNVYGPRQSMEGAYKLVIGVFLEQRTRGEPLTIDGDGLQTRDFTHVRDVVRANLLAGWNGGMTGWQVINIGSGTETTVRRIADLIGGPVVHRAPRGFDERFKRADVSRARELLGWTPTVPIERGIAELIEPQTVSAARARGTR